MCIVSNIADGYQNLFPRQWPGVPTNPVYPIPEISRLEFDALKAEVGALKKLLKEAKRFDERTGQPDCDTEQKVGFLKQIAAALGVDMSDVFPETAAKER